jgi:hypothetical protein
LFDITYLNSTVSFWGATLLKNEKNKDALLCDWLPTFITKSSNIKSLLEFSKALRIELNQRMDKTFLKDEPSGFHLAGINNNGIPEFIHFSNCDFNESNGRYENIVENYKEPFEDFLQRDAVEFGWDGKTIESVKSNNVVRLYRNGDLKAHVAAWDKLDELYNNFFSFPQFRKPYAFSDKDIIKLTRQKLTFISSLYDSWSDLKNVGAPWVIKIIRKK